MRGPSQLKLPVRDNRTFIWFWITFEAGLGLAAVALGWLLGLNPLQPLRSDLPDVLWGVALAGGLLAGMFLVDYVPLRSFRQLSDALDRVIAPLLSGWRWWDAAAVSVAAGVGEEILFRGLIQQGLANWWGVSAALICASVLFGVVHAVTWLYAVLATAAGLALGGLYLWTDNLLPPIIAHALYDFAALLYLINAKGASRLERP